MTSNSTTYSRPAGSTGDALLSRRGRVLAAHLTGRKCPVCGKTYRTGPKRRLTIDHLVPCAKGGHEDLRNNVIGLCGSCNSSKSDQDAAAWLVQRLVDVKKTKAKKISGKLAAALKVASKLEELAVELTRVLDANDAW